MNDIVTLIIPVFNVEEYIDECMRTVISQTYENLDILLINDGSTDGSLDVLRKWERQDERIRVIDQENKGVSACRNLGIELAKGDVIGFIDPDDWLDTRYVEKLYTKLTETGADFTECDIWRYDNRTGKKIYRSCGSVMGRTFTLEEHMKYGPTATYKSLSRKSLWLKNSVRLPDCSFESPAVYSLMLALSNKVENVNEALYYYRRFRENSLIETGYQRKDGSANDTLGIEAMRHLISEYKRCGIYDRYKRILEGIVKYRLSDILAMQFHRRTEQDFAVLRGNYEKFCREAFPDSQNQRFLTFGGYNLNRICSHLDLLSDPYCRFNFSSVIALSHEKTGLPIPEHANRYRQMMLEREFTGAYYEILAEVKPDLLIMDLIEERFDILQTGDLYLTQSDAFTGMKNNNEIKGTRIPRNSDECFSLFRKSFDTFVKKTMRVVPGIRMIMLENLLSEKVGDLSGQELFENIEEIRETNRTLKAYYAFIEQNYPDITVIRTNDLELYFTDKKYEYGAVPSHLNELVNREIAERIMEVLNA